MRRRKMLIATGGLLASATAGCLGTDSGPETTPSTVDVEVEFTVENGDLVVSHLSGDVLQSGQTVYVTVEGDQVAEKTLSSDVHTGGEIIRVTDAQSDFTGEKRVGLYLQQNDQSTELAASSVTITRTQPAPSTQVAFDYDAAAGEVVILHDGGATLNTNNTGDLAVAGDSITDADVTWNAPVTGSGTSATLDGNVSAGDPIVTISNVTNSDESVNLVWNSVGGANSQEIGTWEAP